MGKDLTKNGESSITSMSILILGHWPISSLKLKAYLCSFIIFIRVSFSSDVRSELERSMYLSKISSSVMFLWGSSLSNQGSVSVQVFLFIVIGTLLFHFSGLVVVMGVKFGYSIWWGRNPIISSFVKEHYTFTHIVIA